MEARREAKAPQGPASGLFWDDQGRRALHDQASVMWRSYEYCGAPASSRREGKTGPRIHDLRHSLVVNRILEWYRAGINPQDKLPFLATYLGHRDIHSTLVYITVTQDLLQQATSASGRSERTACMSPEGVQP